MRLLATLLAGLLCFVLVSCPGGEATDDTTDGNGASDEGVWDE